MADDLRSIDELRAVHRASVRLHNVVDPQQLATETIRILEETLGYEFGAVMLVDAATDRLVPFALSDQKQGAAFVDQDRQRLLEHDLRVGRGITGWVAAQGRTVRSGNVSSDPRYLQVRSGLVSELCVPMLIRGQVIGVVNVETSTPDAYTASDQRVMEIIASQIAVAIENSRLLTELIHSQRLDAIGRVTSGIAHDFNNLLTIILGNVENILGRGDIDQELREAAEQIRTAGSQSSRMIQQLLAFGRKSFLQPKVVDIDKEIRAFSPMLQQLLGRSIRLILRGESVAPVEIDPTQFNQALANLAVNAREATPDGGEFSITTRTADIPDRAAPRVKGVRAGRYTIITVADTGCGMDERTRRSLFEPFFSTREGGTGLGLAMVYGLVRQSGGGIAVESQPGAGARFDIYLPVADESPADIDPPPSGESEIAGQVLVIEDDVSVRRLVVALLEDLGYRVLAAADGAEALAVASDPASRVEIVVSDVVLPGLDGPAVVRELRQHLPDLKVLFMSAYPGCNVDENGVFTHSPHLLAKPFTRSTLRQKMLEVIANPEA